MLRPPCRLLLSSAALLGLLAVSVSVPASQIQSPEPADGRWATTTLALLQFNRGLCQAIGNDLRAYWHGLPAAGAEVEQQVRDRVLHRAVTDLAAARAASDLARRFLRGARAEAGPEVGTALERLHGLQTDLCDRVALPTAPRERFLADLDALEGRITSVQSGLGEHLMTDPKSLQADLERYLTAIQLAGLEAEGELVDYVDSITPKPKPPTPQELMDGWYRTYEPAAALVKEALGRFLQARRAGDSPALKVACRDLSAQSVALLERQETVFRSIDPAINRSLTNAYHNLTLLGGHCTVGRFDDVDRDLGEVRFHLRDAGRRLAAYGLRP